MQEVAQQKMLFILSDIHNSPLMNSITSEKLLMETNNIIYHLRNTLQQWGIYVFIEMFDNLPEKLDELLTNISNPHNVDLHNCYVVILSDEQNKEIFGNSISDITQRIDKSGVTLLGISSSLDTSLFLHKYCNISKGNLQLIEERDEAFIHKLVKIVMTFQKNLYKRIVLLEGDPIRQEEQRFTLLRG